MSEPNGNQREKRSGKESANFSGSGRSKRKRNGGPGNSGSGGKSRGQSSQGKGRHSDEQKQHKGSRHKQPHVDLGDFWGDSEALPEPLDHIREAGDVKALVQSLGRVPLSGQETAAEHWFALVYERAAMLAGALAAAGDLHSAETDE